jgi:predicted metal-binding protein
VTTNSATQTVRRPTTQSEQVGESETGVRPTTSVLVCITCRAATDPADAPCKGLTLARATTQALGNAVDVDVVRVRCLGNCNRGLSAAIRRDNAWTYVFGNLNADRDGPALIAGARLFAGSADGLMPWRDRPDPLKRGLIARVPPLDFVGEPADPREVP